MRSQGWGATQISRALGCAQATAVRVARRFIKKGKAGLEDRRKENGIAKVDSDLLQALAKIVQQHLNPRIGRDWMPIGQQKTVVTPGRNKKKYLSGALSPDGTDLIFVAGDRKNTDLFLAQLKELKRRNRKARRIHLVLDNYTIHSSKRAQRYLAEQRGLFQLHFLPPYTPEENKIERLWEDLHANVTRNHRCRSIEELVERVEEHMQAEADRRKLKKRHLRRRRAG